MAQRARKNIVNEKEECWRLPDKNATAFKGPTSVMPDCSCSNGFYSHGGLGYTCLEEGALRLHASISHQYYQTALAGAG